MQRQSTKVPRVCVQCGEAFSVFPSQIVRGDPCRFCSHACMWKGRYVAPSVKLDLTCAQCGAAFSIFPSRLKYGTGLYCGKACAYLGIKANTIERNTVPCDRCGALFIAGPHDRFERGRRFCSRACSAETQRTTMQRPLVERFWPKVDKHGPARLRNLGLGRCWEWTADREPLGYGSVYRVYPQRVRAHRIAWELATGDRLARHQIIGHICDNPPCVRNDSEGVYEVNGVVLPRRGHLFVGSQGDNVRDMWIKGRQKIGRRYSGSKNSQSRLTEAQVLLIRALYAAGGVTQTELAHRFGVSPAAIGFIITRKTWSHVLP